MRQSNGASMLARCVAGGPCLECWRKGRSRIKEPPEAGGLVRGGRTPGALLSAVIANRGCETLYRPKMVGMNAIRGKRSRPSSPPVFIAKAMFLLGRGAEFARALRDRGRDP